MTIAPRRRLSPAALLAAASAAIAVAPALGQQGARDPKLPDMVPLEPYIPPPFRSPIPPRSTSIPLSVTTWTPLGPAPILNGQTPGGMPCSGRLTGLAGLPGNANTIYVSAAGGGVWKTTNGGASWTPLTDSQTTLAMGAIALAPSNPSIIYAGTGEANNSSDSMYGRGILKSTDAGATWTLLGNSVFNRIAVSQIAVDPTNANTVYVATASASQGVTGNRGVWKSTDGGLNWTNTTTALTSTLNFTDIVINPTTPQTLYTAIGVRTGDALNGVYKSTNGGTSWAVAGNFPVNDLTNGRIRVALCAATPSTLYASIANATNGQLYKMMKSTDSGTTWTQTAAAPTNYLGSQGWYDTTLAVSPTNANTVFAAGLNVTMTTNGGTSWTTISSGADGNGPHVDHHAIGFDAAGKLLVGSDGGIWRLDNPTAGSIQWSDLNGNLNTIQFVGIALDPSNADVAYGGSQDNGTSKFNNSLAWTLIEGGDGGMVKVDPGTPATVYHIAPVGSFGVNDWFRRSDDYGLSWASKVSGLVNSTSALFYAPFMIDPASASRLLLGTNVVNNTADEAENWARLPGDTFTFPAGIDHVALGASSATTVYATAGGGVYVSTNNGTSWTQRNPAGVTDHFRRFAVDPVSSNTCYLVRDRFNPGGHVFRTTNAGVAWTDISSNLPDLPTQSIVLDPGPTSANTDDILYVGMDAGVYMSSNLGASWSLVGAGLPNARVMDLELNKNLRILAAGTYGRGLWELSLPRLDLGPITFTDAVTGNNNGVPDSGETIVFTVPVINPNSVPVTSVTATIAGNAANYGTIPALSTVSRTIPYTVPCGSICGSFSSVPIALSSSLGAQTAATSIVLGTPGAQTVERFDSVSVPNLPPRWSSSQSGAGTNWVTSTTSPVSAPNSVFTTDAASTGTADLVTPPIFVPAANTHVVFKLLFNTEAAFDFVALEISDPTVIGGAFQDILAAGGSFAAGAYNAVAYGRLSWNGLSAGTTAAPAYITPDVILPASAVGKSIRLRLHVDCDGNTIAAGAAGVRIDDFPVTTYTCASPYSAQPPTQTVNPGSPASFSVTAPAATSFQWRKNSVNIPGATLSTYTIASTTPSDAGSYTCSVTACGGAVLSSAAVLNVSCYANCDGSTGAPVLTANDFQCFLNRFAAGEAYANCDASTGSPTLTANDFQCFLNKFAAGCT